MSVKLWGHGIVVACAATLSAIGCAGGVAGGADDAASFGPGGNEDASATNSQGSATSGVDDSDSMTSQGPGDGGNCDDQDGDGYGDNCAAGDDCDDDDPDINPGAPELCNEIDDNCDGAADNGCDCPDDGVSGKCNEPTELGTLMPGDMITGVVANVPQEGAIDWYSISYPAAVRPGEGMPSLEFAINDGDAFVFDIVQMQCDAMGAPCTSGGTNGAAVGVTTWTFIDDDPGCCTPPNDSMVAWPDTVYIRVYRTTAGDSCATYQLQATR